MKFSEAKNNLIIIATITILGAVMAYLSTNFLESGFVKTQYFLATTQNEESVTNIDRLESFTETAAAVIQTPDFTKNLNITEVTIESKKVAPYLVKVSVNSKNSQDSARVLMETIDSLNTKFSETTPFNKFSLVPVGVSPEPVYSALNSKILTLTGAVLGFLGALFLIYIAKILKL